MTSLTRWLAGFFLVVAAFAAHAGDADFTLVNRTGYEIESIFVAPTKQKSWGTDFLKDGTLRDGKKVKISFNKNSNQCIYDLRVHWVGYGEDEDTTWERIDLCAVQTLTLRYNRKTNETIAELD